MKIFDFRFIILIIVLYFNDFTILANIITFSYIVGTLLNGINKIFDYFENIKEEDYYNRF